MKSIKACYANVIGRVHWRVGSATIAPDSEREGDASANVNLQITPAADKRSAAITASGSDATSWEVSSVHTGTCAPQAVSQSTLTWRPAQQLTDRTGIQAFLRSIPPWASFTNSTIASSGKCEISEHQHHLLEHAHPLSAAVNLGTTHRSFQGHHEPHSRCETANWKPRQCAVSADNINVALGGMSSVQSARLLVYDTRNNQVVVDLVSDDKCDFGSLVFNPADSNELFYSIGGRLYRLSVVELQQALLCEVGSSPIYHIAVSHDATHVAVVVQGETQDCFISQWAPNDFEVRVLYGSSGQQQMTIPLRQYNVDNVGLGSVKSNQLALYDCEKLVAQNPVFQTQFEALGYTRNHLIEFTAQRPYDVQFTPCALDQHGSVLLIAECGFSLYSMASKTKLGEGMSMGYMSISKDARLVGFQMQGRFRLWSLADPIKPVPLYQSHCTSARHDSTPGKVAFELSPQGDMLAVVSARQGHNHLLVQALRVKLQPQVLANGLWSGAVDIASDIEVDWKGVETEHVAIRWLPESERLLLGHQDGRCCLVDFDTGTAYHYDLGLACASPERSGAQVRHFILSPDGKLLFRVVNDSHQIFIHVVPSAVASIHVLASWTPFEHELSYGTDPRGWPGCAFSDVGGVVVLNQLKTLLICDVRSGEIKVLQEDTNRYQNSVLAISPDGSWLAFLDKEACLVLSNLRAAMQQALRLKIDICRASAVAGGLHLDETTGEIDGMLRSATFHPQGSMIAATVSIRIRAKHSYEELCCLDVLQVWSLPYGDQILVEAQLTTSIFDHKTSWQCCFSYDGSWLVTSRGAQLFRTNTRMRAPGGCLTHPAPVSLDMDPTERAIMQLKGSTHSNLIATVHAYNATGAQCDRDGDAERDEDVGGDSVEDGDSNGYGNGGGTSDEVGDSDGGGDGSSVEIGDSNGYGDGSSAESGDSDGEGTTDKGGDSDEGWDEESEVTVVMRSDELCAALWRHRYKGIVEIFWSASGHLVVGKYKEGLRECCEASVLNAVDGTCLRKVIWGASFRGVAPRIIGILPDCTAAVAVVKILEEEVDYSTKSRRPDAFFQQGHLLLLSPTSCVGVTPDARMVHWTIQNAAKDNDSQTYMQGILKFKPMLLHEVDIDGKSLAMHMATEKHINLKDLSFLINEATTVQEPLRLLSSKLGDSAIQQLLQGHLEHPNPDQLALLQAVFHHMGVGPKPNPMCSLLLRPPGSMTGWEYSKYWPLVEYICNHQARLFVEFLDNLPRKLQAGVAVATAVGEELTLLTGASPHMRPGGPVTESGCSPASVNFQRQHNKAGGIFSSRSRALDGGSSPGDDCIGQLELQIGVPYVIPLAGAAHVPLSGRKSLLRLLLSAEYPARLFATPTVHALIDLKWKAYAKGMVVKEALLHSLMLGCFAAFCILLPESLRALTSRAEALALTPLAAGSHEPVAVSVLACFAMLALVDIIMIRGMCREVLQWKAAELWATITSVWNITDALIFMLITALSGIMLALAFPQAAVAAVLPNCYTAVTVLAAVSSVLCWSRLLRYCMAFSTTGPLVRMVIEIIKDIRWFLLLVLSLSVGFGLAFYLLFHPSESEDIQLLFSNVPRTALTMLSMMTGSFDQNLFWGATAPWLAVLLLVVYVLLIIIVLFNLLIALMGGGYDRVKETEEAEFLRGRADVIDEMEAMLTAWEVKQLNSTIPPYVHYMMPSKKELVAADDDRVWRQEIRCELEALRGIVQQAVVGKHEESKEQTDIVQLKAELADIKRLLHQLLSHAGNIFAPSAAAHAWDDVLVLSAAEDSYGGGVAAAGGNAVIGTAKKKTAALLTPTEGAAARAEAVGDSATQPTAAGSRPVRATADLADLTPFNR